MSTRHVDARTQAVSPESVVVPVKGNVAKFEAAWAARIPEPDKDMPVCVRSCVCARQDFGPVK